MSIAAEMKALERLDEVEAYAKKCGIEISLRRSFLFGEWHIRASIKLLREAGVIECDGKGTTFMEALHDAGKNMDLLLTQCTTLDIEIKKTKAVLASPHLASVPMLHDDDERPA